MLQSAVGTLRGNYLRSSPCRGADLVAYLPDGGYYLAIENPRRSTRIGIKPLWWGSHPSTSSYPPTGRAGLPTCHLPTRSIYKIDRLLETVDNTPGAQCRPAAARAADAVEEIVSGRRGIEAQLSQDRRIDLRKGFSLRRGAHPAGDIREARKAPRLLNAPRPPLPYCRRLRWSPSNLRRPGLLDAQHPPWNRCSGGADDLPQAVPSARKNSCSSRALADRLYHDSWRACFFRSLRSTVASRPDPRRRLPTAPRSGSTRRHPDLSAPSRSSAPADPLGRGLRAPDYDAFIAAPSRPRPSQRRLSPASGRGRLARHRPHVRGPAAFLPQAILKVVDFRRATSHVAQAAFLAFSRARPAREPIP